MNVNEEIKKMIGELVSRERYSSIDSEKLLYLFRNIELDVPDSVTHTEPDLAEIRRAGRDEQTRLFPVSWNITRVARRAALPAAAMIIVLILAGTGLDLIKRGSRAKAYAVRGRVEVERGSDRLILKKGDVVYRGDVIVTGDNSSADFTVNRTVRLRCLDNSRVLLDRMSLDDKGAQFNAVIRSGGLFLYIDKLERGSMVSVTTPESEAVVRGTLFGVNLGKKGSASFEVYDGKIRVKNRIPDEYRDLEPALAEKLESYYEKNAYVVNKNDLCKIAPNRDLYRGLTGENISRRLHRVSIPAVVPGAVKNFSMGKDARSFIADAIEEKGTRRLKEIIKVITDEEDTARSSTRAFNRKQLNGFSSSFIVSPGNSDYVIMINSSGQIVATDLKRVIWKQHSGGTVSARPLLAGKTLYVTTDTERLTSYNAKTGAVLFSIPLLGSVSSPSGPVLFDNSLYAATTRGHLYRISLQGKTMWNAVVDGHITATPFMAGHLVFVPLEGGVLMGLDRRSGVKVLRVPFSSEIIATAARGNNIYVSVKGGHLYCFNYYMDRILWDFNTEGTANRCIVADSDSLYVCNSNGTIFSVSPSGELVWRAETGDEVKIGPEIDDRYLYVAGSEVLQVIDKLSGNIIWAIGLPSISARNIALSRDRIYILSEKRGLIVLKK